MVFCLNSFKKCLIIPVFFAGSIFAYAQPPGCPCDPGQQQVDPVGYQSCLDSNPQCLDSSVPINKNIILLVLAMTAFGIYKLSKPLSLDRNAN